MNKLDTTHSLIVAIETGEKILVDFYTSWCQPCKVMAPMLEAASSKFPKIKFYKIDVDDCQESLDEFDIMGVPTFILFEKGVELSRRQGTMSKNDLESWIANGFATKG